MLRGVVVIGLVAACGFRPSVANQEAGTGGEPMTPMDSRAGEDARPGDAKIFLDSPRPSCDSTACALVGGACNTAGDTCVIHATMPGPLVCPSGQSCQIECDHANACESAIDCAGAAACEIDCNVQNTCAGTIDCSGPGCTLYCRDQNTCDNITFDCGTNAAACDLECCQMNTCGGDLNNAIGTVTLHDPGVCP